MQNGDCVHGFGQPSNRRGEERQRMGDSLRQPNAGQGRVQQHARAHFRQRLLFSRLIFSVALLTCVCSAGNSAFEIADHITGRTQYVHMASRNRVRLAYEVHTIDCLFCNIEQH